MKIRKATKYDLTREEKYPVSYGKAFSGEKKRAENSKSSTDKA